jgi:hypothetical protein
MRSALIVRYAAWLLVFAGCYHVFEMLVLSGPSSTDCPKVIHEDSITHVSPECASASRNGNVFSSVAAAGCFAVNKQRSGSAKGVVSNAKLFEHFGSIRCFALRRSY